MADETLPPQAAPTTRSAGSRLKWIVVALAVLGLAALAWVVLRAADDDKRLERWDQYAKLREQHEGDEQYLGSEGPLYQVMRDRYVQDLETLLVDVEAEASDDALAPQIRWRIVKTEGESLVAMKDVLDVDKRRPHAERALRHLEVLKQRYPNYPLNWTGLFAPKDSINQTRRLIDWFTKNMSWQNEHLPKSTAPDATTVVVLRTKRGDLRVPLYVKEAPQFSAHVVANVRSGRLDGTCFTVRVESSVGGETSTQALRAGDPRSLGAAPHDRAGHLAFAENDALEGLLPDESRHRVLHLRGVVTSWHDQDLYDDPQQLLFVVRDSPGLNYKHTPVGRILDEASLATLDRIFAARLWRENAAVGAEASSPLKELLQVPVAIVKALAYKDGALLAVEGTAAPNRVAPDESEQSLSALKADAYREEEPAPPAPPAPTPDSSTKPQ